MTDWLTTSRSTEPIEGLETASDISPDGCPQDAELLTFTEARRWRIGHLKRVEANIAELQVQREKLIKEVAALDSLLGHHSDSTPYLEPDTTVVTQSQAEDLSEPSLEDRDLEESRRSPALAESVDATLEVLRQHGRPLHYRQIYDKVTEMGISVIGKDPAAVLLARFSRDPRFQRVGSGTYMLAPDTEDTLP